MSDQTPDVLDVIAAALPGRSGHYESDRARAGWFLESLRAAGVACVRDPSGALRHGDELGEFGRHEGGTIYQRWRRVERSEPEQPAKTGEATRDD